MANRSHIYTCDEIPGGKGFHARGLSEYNWAIPLAHKLMVGTNPRIVRSAIWEHDIGILADREGAFERTLALFDKLGEGEVPDRSEFDEELAQLKEFLASAPPSKFILLEAGEILDLLDGELPALVADLHAELAPLAAKTDRAIAGEEADWLSELRANWAEEARPGYWSDILYYSFSEAPARKQPAANKKPAVKQPAAKQPAAKKPAVKKPAVKKPAVKKAAVKKAAAKKPAAKQPAVKKAAVKKAAAKQPAAKQPAAKKPAHKKR